MSKDIVVTLEYKRPSRFWRIIFWFFGLLLLSLAALIIYFNWQTNKLIDSFSTGAEISKEEFFQTSNQFLTDLQKNYQKVDQLPQKFNFLILGTDKLSGRDDDPELTDSIMLLQFDFTSGEIKTISLPRDLYNNNYQTRINALYYYGQEKTPAEPIKFAQETLTEMTGVKIDYTIVIGIEDLEKLIDLVDGVEINVPKAFKDPNFPIPGVDVSIVRDPKLLYEEISFATGPQQMDSATALKYMRSRYSEGDEGTDLARSARQQLVLQALTKKILANRDPVFFGQLYRFYLDKFAKYLSPAEISKITSVYLRYIEKTDNPILNFVQHRLSVYPDDPNGVIYNPPLWQSKQQWIYQIKDQQIFEESFDAIFN